MAEKKSNPRKPTRYDGAAERADRVDQQASLRERQTRRTARRERAAFLAQLREQHEAQLAATPARLRPLYERILRRLVALVHPVAPFAVGGAEGLAVGSIDPVAQREARRERIDANARDVRDLLGIAHRVGFVCAMVSQIDDADYGKRPLSADRLASALDGLSPEQWKAAHIAVLRAGLEHEHADVRTWAAKMLPVYVTDPARLTKLLLPTLRGDAGEARWHAALTLARAGDASAEVIAALAEAVGELWISHRRRHWDRGETGRELAALALGVIGPAAKSALPALRAALVRFDDTVAFGEARFAIADAIVRIAGRTAAVSAATEALQSMTSTAEPEAYSARVLTEVLAYLGHPLPPGDDDAAEE